MNEPTKKIKHTVSGIYGMIEIRESSKSKAKIQSLWICSSDIEHSTIILYHKPRLSCVVPIYNLQTNKYIIQKKNLIKNDNNLHLEIKLQR